MSGSLRHHHKHRVWRNQRVRPLFQRLTEMCGRQSRIEIGVFLGREWQNKERRSYRRTRQALADASRKRRAGQWK